jgi:protein LSM14
MYWQASATIPQQAYGFGGQARPAPPQAIPVQQTQPGPSYGAAPAQQPAAAAAAQPAATGNNRRGGVHTATASMETVERALGDLRSGSTEPGGRGSRRGGRNGGEKGPGPAVPTTDFDFQSNNARFDKVGLKPQRDGEDVHAADGDEEEEEIAYNPQKSFFDSLTPSRGGPGGGERGRGRGRGGRSRRDEERDKNVATFGEPGGVGLMGPGAYVGGYGGRRGGGRGRRQGGGGRS